MKSAGGSDLRSRSAAPGGLPGSIFKEWLREEARGTSSVCRAPRPPACSWLGFHAIKIPIEDWRWSVVWMGVVTGAAALMASTVRFRSFKDIPWARRQPSVLIVPIAVLVPLIFFFSEYYTRIDRDVLCSDRSCPTYRAHVPPSLGFPSRLKYEPLS